LRHYKLFQVSDMRPMGIIEPQPHGKRGLTIQFMQFYFPMTAPLVSLVISSAPGKALHDIEQLE